MEEKNNQNNAGTGGQSPFGGARKGPGRPRKETIFWAKNERLTIGANQLKRETRNNVTGVVESRSGLIAFHDHTFKTSDPDVIKAIENSHVFKIGKVKVVSEEQYYKLLGQVATPEKVVSTATSPAGSGLNAEV